MGIFLSIVVFPFLAENRSSSLVAVVAMAAAQHDREGDIMKHLSQVCQSYISHNRRAEKEQLKCSSALLSTLVEEEWRR